MVHRMIGAVVFFAAAFGSNVFASQDRIVVSGCDGSMLAFEEIDVGVSRDLVLNGSFSDGELFTLVNVTTLESKAAQGAEALRFDHLTAGDWRLCSATGTQVPFSQVKFYPHQASDSWRGLSALALLGAVVTPLAILNQNDSNEGVTDVDEPLSDSGAGPSATVPTGSSHQSALADPEVEYLDEDYPFGAPASRLSPFS